MAKRWRGSGDSIPRLQWGDKTKRVEVRLTEFEYATLLDTMKALEWKARAVSGFLRALILAEADRVKAGTAKAKEEEAAEDAAWDAAHPEPLRASPSGAPLDYGAAEAAARPLLPNIQLLPPLPLPPPPQAVPAASPTIPDLSHLTLSSLQLPLQPPPPPEEALREGTPALPVRTPYPLSTFSFALARPPPASDAQGGDDALDAEEAKYNQAQAAREATE